MTTPAIQCEGLQKVFYGQPAVEAVTLSLPAGSRTSLQGPSGGGKTTLLRLIAGLERPDQGAVYLAGRLASSPDFLLPPAERGLGFVFQSPALWPHLTVVQNIRFGLQPLAKEERRWRLQQSLARSGLVALAGRYPAQLSGGQARRVSIARTLAMRPALLLLDEPLIYLDPDWKGKILTWILETVAETGATLLYVTHDPQEAEQVAWCRLVMEGGKIHP